MSFFTDQEFINYFVLVALAVVLTASSFALVAVRDVRATPGQRLLGLRLVSLSGDDPSGLQLLARMALAIVRILLIMVPGPLVALVIGLTAAAVLEVPFSTTDRLLLQSGLPDTVRYGLHGLSFVALFAALWMLVIHPLLRYWEGRGMILTPVDLLSRTTYVHMERRRRPAA